jgi:hypothetical protein
MGEYGKRHIEGHYEVHRVPYGTEYVWVPAEEEVDERLVEQLLHPWRAEERRRREEEQHQDNPELQEWLELQAL